MMIPLLKVLHVLLTYEKLELTEYHLYPWSINPELEMFFVFNPSLARGVPGYLNVLKLGEKSKNCQHKLRGNKIYK